MPVLVSVRRQSPGASCHLSSTVSPTFISQVFETTFLHFSPKILCRGRSGRPLGSCIMPPAPISLVDGWQLYSHETVRPLSPHLVPWWVFLSLMGKGGSLQALGSCDSEALRSCLVVERSCQKQLADLYVFVTAFFLQSGRCPVHPWASGPRS